MPEPKGVIDKFKITINRNNDGKIDKKWLLIVILAAVFILALIILTLIFLFETKYAKQFFPGSRLGQLSLEGLTSAEALNMLDPVTQKIEQDGIRVVYKKDENSNLKFASAIDGLSDPDLSREILNYDDHKTVYQSFTYARSGNWLNDIPQQLEILLLKKQFSAAYDLDEDALNKLLKQQFAAEEKPFQNAKPQISCQKDDCQIEILPEKNGLTFDYSSLINTLKNNLSNLDNQVIELKPLVSNPEITLAEVENQKPTLEKIMASPQPELIYEKDSWKISRNDLGKMLEFKKIDTGITIGINQEQFAQWLQKNIEEEINVPAKNAMIEIKDGQVIKLSTHQAGLAVDEEKVYQDFNNNILMENATTTISVKQIEPEVATENINDLGIKEIIGIGESNFAGSPTNRRFNIKNGASKLHGLLIKPGEEFSLLNALGPVDGTTGYRTELVIKGNKTTPEYGGGLCQIGTTIFRAAMGSGLPVTERQNHSYSVTYYLEGGLPGVDATIYIPKPDVKFVNDTGNYILIQAKIKGDNLSFEFWGTKDGRQAERTKPKVWGWVSPPPTKYIESLALPVGQKKCTESSHKGVNTSFDYLVTMPNGEERKQTFTSHYKPWQAVCLIGVEKLSEASGNNSSSTVAVTN